MSRFENLEFQSPGAEVEPQTTQQKDEAFFLGEARQAFADWRLRAVRCVIMPRALEYNAHHPVVLCWPGALADRVGRIRRRRRNGRPRPWNNSRHDVELLAARVRRSGEAGQTGVGAWPSRMSAVEERGNTPYLWLSRADVLLARG
jgi:hypothetical protein